MLHPKTVVLCGHLWCLLSHTRFSSRDRMCTPPHSRPPSTVWHQIREGEAIEMHKRAHHILRASWTSARHLRCMSQLVFPVVCDSGAFMGIAYIAFDTRSCWKQSVSVQCLIEPDCGRALWGEIYIFFASLESILKRRSFLGQTMGSQDRHGNRRRSQGPHKMGDFPFLGANTPVGAFSGL